MPGRHLSDLDRALELAYGRNRDALRGTEWEAWIRWPWEDDPSPGPSCPAHRVQLEIGLTDEPDDTR